MDNLTFLKFDGQDLCAPSDDEFQAWLGGILGVYGPTCAAVAPVSFTDRIANQSFPRAQKIDPFILPEATGGTPPVVYGLTPTLPAGLTFDAITRTISGTPTVVTAPTPYTYKATGETVPPTVWSSTLRYFLRPMWRMSHCRRSLQYKATIPIRFGMRRAWCWIFHGRPVWRLRCWT